jgi:serpin B
MMTAKRDIVVQIDNILMERCIAGVEHATVVEVDETGTVAAGATTVTVGTTAMEVPVVMTMDHPFLYVIRDDKTGELLFVGALQDPS